MSSSGSCMIEYRIAGTEGKSYHFSSDSSFGWFSTSSEKGCCMAKKKLLPNKPKKLTKKISKKKTTTIKSPASSSKRSGPTKKGKVVKVSSKSQKKGRTGLKEKTLTSKKTIRTEPSGQRSVDTKTVRPASRKKKVSATTTERTPRTRSRSASSSIPSAGSQTGVAILSHKDRYNVGGLFACAIDRASDPDFKRLRTILRHLDLSSQEKDNLLRLSQGMLVPKLFADGLDEHKVRQALRDVIGFASAEGAYEKKWRNEIRQVGIWLGLFPEQFDQIEQKILKK
jgi:hypothetical protein